MARETDICNMALSYLGANQIIEMSDETPEAQLCQLNFDSCRDAVLEDVNWTFATRRYRIDSALEAKPEFGFYFAYQLPQEILRVISVNENKYSWVLEDRMILTDRSVVDVRAIVRVEDSSKFPPNFVKCLAAYLAAEIALPLTNSNAMYQDMAQMYLAKKIWAQGNDGRQGKSERRTSSEWKR